MSYARRCLMPALLLALLGSAEIGSVGQALMTDLSFSSTAPDSAPPADGNSLMSTSVLFAVGVRLLESGQEGFEIRPSLAIPGRTA